MRENRFYRTLDRIWRCMMLDSMHYVVDRIFSNFHIYSTCKKGSTGGAMHDHHIPVPVCTPTDASTVLLNNILLLQINERWDRWWIYQRSNVPSLCDGGSTLVETAKRESLTLEGQGSTSTRQQTNLLWITLLVPLWAFHYLSIQHRLLVASSFTYTCALFSRLRTTTKHVLYNTQSHSRTCEDSFEIR